MATKDFDYEGFAQNLAMQAQELVPQDFNDEQKQYVINTLGNFSMMAGKTLAEDKSLNFNAEQSTYITQIIAEWSFHKSIDIIRSGIPRQYWDSIMQKIAYTIFEIAKQTFSQGLPTDKIIELIEHHVNKTYVDAITELKNKGIIDEGLMEFAASQSNMNKMAQEMQEQAQVEQAQAQNIGQANNQEPNLPQVADGAAPVSQTDPNKVGSKSLKLATVAMLFNRMNRDRVQTILNKLDDDDAEAVVKYMQVPDLEKKVGAQNTMRCLYEIKMNLPRSTDVVPEMVVKKIKDFASQYTEQDLERLLIKERINVKRLVVNALEDKFYDKIPPKVASIVASHLQSIV